MNTSEDQASHEFESARTLLSSLQGRSPYEDGTDVMEVIETLELFTREIDKHPEVQPEELLHLLDFGGVIAEFAARCLYLRTGRDDLHWRPAGFNGLRFVVERTDWESYLSTWRASNPSAPPPLNPASVRFSCPGLLDHPAFLKRVEDTLRHLLTGSHIEGRINGEPVEGMVTGLEISGPIHLESAAAGPVYFNARITASALTTGTGEMFARTGGIAGQFELGAPVGVWDGGDLDSLARHAGITDFMTDGAGFEE